MDIATAINLSCLWEATAAKPGNVNRSSDFADVNLVDFLSSAAVLGSSIQRSLLPQATPGNWPANTETCPPLGNPVSLGNTILAGTIATKSVARSNTNLGMVLLLSPLAHAVAAIQSQTFPQSPVQIPNCGIDPQIIRTHLSDIINQAGVDQTQLMYQAISIANPGGMNKVKSADATSQTQLEPTDTISHVMGLASQRDSIASEYTTGFEITFGQTLPRMDRFLQLEYPLQWVIIGTYLQLLASVPDTLIQRKLGPPQMRAISKIAERVVTNYFPEDAPFPMPQFNENLPELHNELADFDFHLRSDGNNRNPGTTADLIAAGLFLCLCTDRIRTPILW